MDAPLEPEKSAAPYADERQFAHRIKNLLSPAALYLDAVLLREARLGERSREQLLEVQAVIEQVCRELENLQDRARAPVVVAPSEAAASPVQAGHASPPLRILLVDDDPLLLSSLSRTLGFDQHTVQCASSAEQAMNLAAQAHAEGLAFQAVITDLTMQGMDGQGLARHLKAQGLTEHVILLTGWGSAPGADPELPEGVDQWLAKPARLAALRQALLRVGGP